MSSQALMIQTDAKRRYYTDPENLPMLVEFAKTFGAELTLVDSPEIEVMPLDLLAPALCDDNYRSPKIGQKVRIVRKLYPEQTNLSPSRQDMIRNAKMIQNYIRGTLSKNKIIRVSAVKEEFRNLNLTHSCISNHVTCILREFENKGLKVKKLKPGSYQLTDS